MQSKDWSLDNMPGQSGRVAIVTGANSGIGYETARALSRAGATVIMACRNQQKAGDAQKAILSENPSAKVELADLNLASLNSVSAFAKSFNSRFSRLDLLINNAGVMVPPYELTEDGFELQIGTNYLGHFALTGQLLDNILATPDSRIVSVSSIAHRKGRIHFDDIHFKRRYSKMQAYAQSKIACLLFAYELDRRLTASGVNTLSVAAHPGVTKSELVSHTALIKALLIFAQETPEGALPIVRAATDPDVKGGEYYGPRGIQNWRGAPVKEVSCKRSRNETDARRLWQISEDMTGVKFLSK